MYVPVYQGLTPFDLLRPGRSGPMGFPFDAPRRWYFYRARNAIYHLFRSLRARRPLTVLAPDYNSGNEVLAMHAAGATVRYCPVDRGMRLDPADVERRCDRYAPDVLYVIHYAGWAQPMAALVDLCRRRNMLLVEDCALALLSGAGDRPLGSFGDWSVFCLYKTLPLPNGAVLVQNADNARVETEIDALPLRSAGIASAAGRTAELLLQRLRSRADRIGAGLHRVKGALGRAASALHVERAKVGDIGFELDDVDLAMSGVSKRLLRGLDFDAIRERRRMNATRLAELLDGRATRVFRELPDGVCPLFFPILVPDKHAAALALQARGVDALEFWNYGFHLDGCDVSAAARFLRAHVLELPIHQDLTSRHIDHVARQVTALDLRMHDVADSVFAA
jgi:dTDP-4-amino-4,6-dideoxygalactose transaminase